MSTALYEIPPAVAACVAAAGGDVAEYERVSRDRTGAGLAVTRQSDEIHDKADVKPTRRYADNDMSAYSGKPRTHYLRLLDDIRAGLIRVLWVWHTDRLHRSNAELEDFIRIIEQAEREHGIRVEIRSVIGSPIDLNTAAGRANARFLATVATLESDLKRERIRAKVRQKVAKGEFHGGRRRFGYNADMSALDVTEAAIIRQIAADLIKGRSLHNVARELNENGTPPPMWKGVPFRMSEWTGSNLGTMMRRPHLAGLRVHEKKVAGDGSWTPILDRATWETLQAVLSKPGRRTAPAGTARKHLLTGIATCAECGKPLRMRSEGTGKPPTYACPDSHVSRAMALVDARVSGSVVELLARPDFVAVWLPEPDGDRATLESRIESIETDLEAWADRQMRGQATARQVERATQTGMAEIARLRGLLSTMAAAAAVPAVLDGLAGNPDAAAAWDALDLDRRRAVIAAMAQVRVHRAARKGAPFDPQSVEITWRLGG